MASRLTSMSHAGRTGQSWITFAGAVLVVGVLSWARDLLMPMALAALLTFMLARPVGALQRWIGRTSAVLVTVSLVFALLGVALGAWARSSRCSWTTCRNTAPTSGRRSGCSRGGQRFGPEAPENARRDSSRDRAHATAAGSNGHRGRAARASQPVELPHVDQSCHGPALYSRSGGHPGDLHAARAGTAAREAD